MKNFTFTLALLCTVFHFLSAQTLTFNRRYATNRYNDARDIVATPDHGFVFTGLCKGDKDSLGDMYLSKVNAAGALLWTHYYGRPEEDGGNAVLVTSDGGYLLTGHTAFSYGSSCDGYLVKTDAAGNEQWRAFVGTAYDDVCSSSIQVKDGYLVTGKIENPVTHQFQIMLVKLAPNGRQIFMKTLETTLPAVGYKIAACQDGNILIAGYSCQYDNDVLVVKATPNGTVLWEAKAGGTLDERAYSVLPLADGSVEAIGSIVDAFDRPMQMLALRIDADGVITRASNVLINNQFGGLYDVMETASGKIAVAGVLSSEIDARAVPVMGYLDEQLEVHEWRSGDYTASCRTRCMAQGVSGDFVLAGNVQQPDTYGIFITKISEPKTGNVQNVDEVPFLLFPNPFQDFFYLKTGVVFQPKLLTLATATGKIVRHIVFDQPEILIHREGLPAGCYSFSVWDAHGNLIRSGKISAQ